MTTAFALMRRHFAVVIAAGGAILIVMGVLGWTGELFHLNVVAQRLLDRVVIDFFNQV